MIIPKVIEVIVKNDLCIGCGVCVYACPSNALEMQWDAYGFLIPKLARPCDSCEDCIKVCPFNPFPEKEVRTERELANSFISDTPKYNPKIGKYNAIYAGYANEFRIDSSSGGMGTFICTELLANGIVDYVFSVKESHKLGSHYEYAVSSSREDLLKASKTKYFPVSLGNVMSEINSLEGKVAIVGVACFIKAIRLAQYKEPALKIKIPFLVGIICGGVKSRFFTEYLADRAGVEKQNIQSPEFRIKDHQSTSDDYSYSCFDIAENKEKTIKMRMVGDMWGTGLFKANACDFCDDVTTELADISLGDAWLSPFNNNGSGTNVVVVRSAIAKQLIKDGIEKGKLTIEDLSLERFLASQQGSFNHRHTGLSVRIEEAKKKRLPVPPKRFGSERVNLFFQMVQINRIKVRQMSLELWKEYPNASQFDGMMERYLVKLKKTTRRYHRYDRVIKYLKSLFKNITDHS